MKIIYAFIIALILSVLAFFLASCKEESHTN